jgi:5-methyltetrahydrofolate--homocysteine methyltransferase
MRTVLSSASREAVISPAEPFCIIGERINPTGRELFSEQLRRGDQSRIEADVAEQAAGGAMDLLLDHDPWGAAWIAAHRAQQAAAP